MTFLTPESNMSTVIMQFSNLFKNIKVDILMAYSRLQ